MDDKDIARITNSLCTHCSKLRSLAVKGTIDTGLKATLIRNCAVSKSLSEIVVIVPNIDNRIADSIAFHASTLETPGILIMTEDPVELDRLFQLQSDVPASSSSPLVHGVVVKPDLLDWTLSGRQHGEGKASRRLLTWTLETLTRHPSEPMPVPL